MMPKMDGFEFLAALRATPNGNESPLSCSPRRTCPNSDASGSPERSKTVLRKSMHSRDELAAELRRALRRGTQRSDQLPKILYVEDNEDNVYMLRRRLAKHGYEMIVAEDGQKGVEAARANNLLSF